MNDDSRALMSVQKGAYFGYLSWLHDGDGTHSNWDHHRSELDKDASKDVLSKRAEDLRLALVAIDSDEGEPARLRLMECLKSVSWVSGINAVRILTLDDTWSPSDRTLDILLGIAMSTPSRVVFINTTICLLTSCRPPSDAFLCSAAQDPELTDLVWKIHTGSSGEIIELDSVILALAKAGSLDTMHWLCEALFRDPSKEIKAAAARYGYSDGTPECSELYGENNPEFNTALIRFIDATNLVELLQAETIDDALCNGALTICSEGLCSCLLNDMELIELKRAVSIEEILQRLVGHLKERTLTLDQLFNLAWLYDCVFEEIDRWLAQGRVGSYDEGDLVINERTHRALATSIREVFWSRDNQAELKRASKRGRVSRINAQLAMARMEGGLT